MSHRDIARALLEQHGTTYAEDAGIRIDDKPAALWQLLVLSLLLSARISSGIAVAAARELFDAGCTTPERTRDTQRRSLIAAFGRSGYRRYDERTSTQLHGLADKVLDDFSGDLRRMHEDCADVPALEEALQRFTGIGPAGAAIFLREVQGVWPDVAPYVDELAAKGADRLGLPTDPQKLADLVRAEDLPRLVAACVRAARDKDVVEGVREA